MTERGSAEKSRRVLLGGGLAAMATGAALRPGRAAAVPTTVAWRLGGNTGVAGDGTNYLGTQNVAPLVLKTAEVANTPLERLRITPVGRVGVGLAAPGAQLDVLGPAGTGVRGRAVGAATTNVGVLGSVTNGTGVQGIATGRSGFATGVRARGHGYGVYSEGGDEGGIGVYGASSQGFAGLYGAGGTYGCYGSGTTYGVYGSVIGVAGVRGSNSSTTGSGVYGDAYGANAAGVFGVNDGGGAGVWGRSVDGPAVYAEGTNRTGVRAVAESGIGVHATSENGGVLASGHVGVQGTADDSAGAQGVRGEDGAGGSSTTTYAGVFVGRTAVLGSLSVSAASSLIDHPLDPANRTLSHAFVGSGELKNIYDGVVSLGRDGTASVELPSYVQALNEDFRYQLTCLGAAAPVYVSQEIAGDRFVIAGGTSGLRVSWQVTGVRKDAAALRHSGAVEQDKAKADRGSYLDPAAFGQPSRRLPGSLAGVRVVAGEDPMRLELPAPVAPRAG